MPHLSNVMAILKVERRERIIIIKAERSRFRLSIISRRVNWKICEYKETKGDLDKHERIPFLPKTIEIDVVQIILQKTRLPRFEEKVISFNFHAICYEFSAIAREHSDVIQTVTFARANVTVFFFLISQITRNIINLNDKRSSPYAARALPNRGYHQGRRGYNAVHI